MPEIDVTWNRLREIIPQFQKEARSSGATRVRGFAQALWLATKGGEQGICYGISCAWILANKAGKNGIDLFFENAAKKFKNDEDDDFYDEVSSKLQKSQFSRHHDGDGLRIVGADHFINAGLCLISTRNFDQKFYRMRSAARYLAHAEGYHMINTPNHTMAAHITDEEWVFFDPNLGEAEFDNAGQFQTFFEKWMSSKRIVKSYRGRKGDNLNDLGAHKTLHLEIDHYN